MGDLVFFPHRSTLPPASADPYLDRLEMAIFNEAIAFIQDPGRDLLHGMCAAREMYLGKHPELVLGEARAEPYAAVVLAAVRALPALDRSRIRHPACSRARAQQVLLRKVDS